MSQRASAWSVTINNPTQTDDYNIAQARQAGWKVEGQLEIGENGTPHYQLLVKTPQVRFSQVKKVFPRAHIEVARNLAALTSYVRKEDTRVSQLQIDQSRYPSQLQMYDWFGSYYNTVKKIDFDKKVDSLKIFDLMCAQKIQQGFMIGSEIMNPQIRSFIKRFGESVWRRWILQQETRQTDRQPEIYSQVVFIPNASQEENAQIQEETNDETSSRDEDEEIDE